jgi:dihydrofolate synthase/folylpolyglutamate synthase
MRAAAAQFANPERRFFSLHVAGTNGKGSVSAMTASMGWASGARVGLYTSPHLCRFSERIQIDGKPVSDAVLLPALQEVLDRCPELTFFETATLTAFVIFARLGVEWAVVEVGLGGRLDATNVLDAPRATAITSISLDHTDRLGKDLVLIAREKAGILKPRVPVVLGRLAPDALAEVLAKAEEVKAPVRLTSDDAGLASFVDLHPPALEGIHQMENARVAVALAREAGVSDDAIAAGLRDVKWYGRLETIRTPGGAVMLDAAHNPDGARALATALRSKGLAPSTVALVFGSMADKDFASMLSSLSTLADHRVYVAPEGRRAADPATIAQLVPGELADTTDQALRLGRRAVGPNGLVVVTGSIFLVGAARAILLGLPRDPPIAL